MKSVFAPLLAVLTLALVMGGCGKSTPPPEEKVLFQAIEDNVRAFDKKDVEAVMATIHPKAPNFAQTRDFIAQMFSEIDLQFAVSDLKVVTSSPEEAQVHFKQKTDKVTKEGVVPLNIVEGIHTLRPDEGKWKIFRTMNTKETRLDTPPAATPESTPPTSEATPPAVPATPPAAEPTPTPAAPTEPAPSPAPPAEKPAQ